MPTYNKLVRDRIPEIIKESGRQCRVTVLKDRDYLAALNDKLTEELEEYYKDGDLAELADLTEVIYAIIKYSGKSMDEFERMRTEKKTERGGFDKGLFLIDVTE